MSDHKFLNPQSTGASVVTVEALYPCISVTAAGGSTSKDLATIMGKPVPVNAGGVVIYPTADTYISVDSTDATSSNFVIAANTVFEIYEQKYALDKLRLNSSGNVSVLLYCGPTGYEEEAYSSSSSSSSESSEGYSESSDSSSSQSESSQSSESSESVGNESSSSSSGE
jgi:hypothetical protein